MGATTKNGRTRNRRALAKSAPPSGYPVIWTIFNPSTVAGNKLRFAAVTQDNVPYPYDTFVGSGRIQLLNDGALGSVMGTITYNSTLDVFDIVLDETWPEGEPFIILPWQETIRGMNGEWLGLTYFTSP